MMKPWPVEGFVLARALWLRMMLLEVAAVEACSRRMEKVRLGSFRQEENTFKRHNSGGTMIVYARCTRRIVIPILYSLFAEANLLWNLGLMSKVYMNLYLYHICIDQSQDSKLSRFSNGWRTWILSTRGMTLQIQPLGLQIFKPTNQAKESKLLAKNTAVFSSCLGSPFCEKGTGIERVPLLYVWPCFFALKSSVIFQQLWDISLYIYETSYLLAIVYGKWLIFPCGSLQILDQAKMIWGSAFWRCSLIILRSWCCGIWIAGKSWKRDT